MALTFYGHLFSSYCQKALIALYENDTPFQFRSVDLGSPADGDALGALWPFRKFPVVTDGDATVIEASIIIEYLDIHHRGEVRFLPDDHAAALDVRFVDRFIDNYVHSSLQKIVGNALRPEAERDPRGVADACRTLDTAYRWLDARIAGRDWVCSDAFSLADCSAAPALFYADWAYPISADLANVRAYRKRLNARPSFARCIEDARPFRNFFPLGAPDQD